MHTYAAALIPLPPHLLRVRNAYASAETLPPIPAYVLY